MGKNYVKHAVKTVNVVGMFILLCFVVCSSSFAAPPDKWDVGNLVFVDYNVNEYIIQFPGAPSEHFCSNNPTNTDWCLNVECNITGVSTYSCEEIPLLHVCLGFQISSGEIKKVINVDSDGCK